MKLGCLLTVIALFSISLVAGSEASCECSSPTCTNNSCTCTNSTGQFQQFCTICSGRKKVTESEGTIYSHDSSIFDTYGSKQLCSVHIESPLSTTIRLYFHFFKTECAWDYVHVHDGSSTHDPTIATFSGRLVDDTVDLLSVDKEVVSSKNSVYVVFRPDSHVEHDGFRISFKVNGCPGWCSGHGECKDGVCQCDSDWSGDSCDTRQCDCLNGGSCKEGVCQCVGGYKGSHCEHSPGSNYWSHTPGTGAFVRSSFGGAVVGDTYWVFGGYFFQGAGTKPSLIKFNVDSKSWSSVHPSGPVGRTGHTITAYKNSLYMYGGEENSGISDELWQFSIDNGTWHQLNPKSTADRIKSTGHCAVLVKDTIYYIGGMDDEGIVIIDIQTFNISSNTWNIISHRDMKQAYYNSRTYKTKFTDNDRVYYGRYSPACTLNPATNRILVFGGLNTTRIIAENLPDQRVDRESTFVEYDVPLNSWGNFYIPDWNTVPRLYQASIEVVDRNLFVFGGIFQSSTANDKQCYNPHAYIVNIETGKGKQLNLSLDGVSPIRIGHGSFVHDNTVYIVGGYNGKLRDDVISFHFQKCEENTLETTCITAREDFTICQWINNNCVTKTISDCGHLKCGDDCLEGDGYDRRCVACLKNSQCTWDQIHPDTCRANDIGLNFTGNVNDQVYQCRDVPKLSRIECSDYSYCQHCKGECYWDLSNRKCKVNVEMANDETICEEHNFPCPAYSVCDQCLRTSRCMWCSLDTVKQDGGRMGKCVETETYNAFFPYGQCTGWAMVNSASCPAESCDKIRNCSLCQSQPECGWCDDDSGTGSGVCMAGKYLAPLEAKCPAKRWYYYTCPKCQCNGHSRCSDSENCDKCMNNTAGTHCDMCRSGYFGQATNGGRCSECSCSRHAEGPCDHLSGRCTCTTLGVIGLHCDECQSGDYVGDALHDTCYYKLQPGTQYTMHSVRRRINFMLHLNETHSKDIDITFRSYISDFALNVTILSQDNQQKPLTQKYPETLVWNDILKKNKYNWDKKPITIRFYLILNETSKSDIKVSVGLDSKEIDLKQFFIIFFACIIILLLSLMLGWTAKIRYGEYRQQRNQALVLMERALRPYKTHRTLFKESVVPISGCIFEVRSLAVEPLFEEKFAIVSYLMTHPGPKDTNLTIGSSIFQTNLPFCKVLSNPNVNTAAV